MEQNNSNSRRINYLQEKLNHGTEMSATQKAYYLRIIKVLDMPDLTKVKGNPVQLIVERIVQSKFFDGFESYISPEVVGEFETFDLFYFPLDHVARRPSDSYFLNKSEKKEESVTTYNGDVVSLFGEI